MRRTCWLLLLLLSLPLAAKDKATPMPWDSLRHDVRIGWGDPLFESAMQYELPHIGKPNTQVDYITGHLFAEYQYYWLKWLSTGVQLDASALGWQDKRDLGTKHNCYNISILPCVRFAYYYSPWVRLYSSVFVGLTINSGTETNMVTGAKTVCYPGFGITALGVQVGKNGFYGAAELGGLYAVNNKNDMAMLSARMLTVSLGYRFK